MPQRSNGNRNTPRRDFLSLAGKGLGLAALSVPVIAALAKEIEATDRVLGASVVT